MRRSLQLALAAGIAASTAAVAQPAGRKVTGPVATYWVSAQTQSGFGMPGMGAGRPSAGAMMGMIMGGGMGGGGAQHLLTLQLGSSRRPQGEPSAEHLPPANLRAGPSLPLVTPRAAPAQREEPTGAPREYQKPRGRMLIFWGCGDRAKPGQPLVIDFAQTAAGKPPPGMEAMTRGLGVSPAQPPSPSRNATYGEWPNERARTTVPGDGSLVGDHVVRGNYSPEIRFSLGPHQDFLAPLRLTTNARTPAGSVQLGWNAVPNAQAYLATAVGGGQQDTMVLWTSSEVQASAFAMPDYLTPGDISRLVASRALMGPQTTRCAAPKEVVDAAPQAMLQLVAYGPEANFVHPPRPSDPKAVWNQEWQAKVRYRSAAGGMLGMDMAAAGDDHGPSRGQTDRPPEPSSGADRKRRILRGLGGGLIPGL